MKNFSLSRNIGMKDFGQEPNLWGTSWKVFGKIELQCKFVAFIDCPRWLPSATL